MQENSLSQRYQSLLDSGSLRADAVQAAAIGPLSALLAGVAPPPRGLLSRLRAKPMPAGGAYLWGDVGRGKSMLMDLFVEVASTQHPTRRVHFHAFMRDVHQRLFAYRNVAQTDPLARVVTELAAETRILCLDELQVTDVADAMILARLFSGVMDAGVTVLFTSNRAPDNLYQGGLQRDQFLAFIALLKSRVTLLEINGDQDYRYAKIRALKHSYHHPLGGAADDFLLQSWAALTDGAANEPLRIAVDGRIIRVDKHARGVAWLTFDELCVRPLGAGDYLALAAECHTLLLQNIPRLTPQDRNEAKRFVTLIDALYDTGTKLISTGDTAPEEIYPAGDGNFEFHRTVSRLNEMQSEAYWRRVRGG